MYTFTSTKPLPLNRRPVSRAGTGNAARKIPPSWSSCARLIAEIDARTYSDAAMFKGTDIRERDEIVEEGRRARRRRETKGKERKEEKVDERERERENVRKRRKPEGPLPVRRSALINSKSARRRARLRAPIAGDPRRRRRGRLGRWRGRARRRGREDGWVPGGREGDSGWPLGGQRFQFLDNWSSCFDTQPHQATSMRNKSNTRASSSYGPLYLPTVGLRGQGRMAGGRCACMIPERTTHSERCLPTTVIAPVCSKEWHN